MWLGEPASIAVYSGRGVVGLSATGPSRSLIDIRLLGGTSVPLCGTLMIAGVPLGSGLSRDGGWCLVRHPARAGMARVEPGIM